MKIAVVGASGFIGRALINHLLTHSTHEIIAISRSKLAFDSPRFEWRACDLHNLLQLEHTLQGAETAVYLIHSMLPGARLNQGSFSDFDLSLADNFGRTARLHGIQRVIYLSGLIPDHKGHTLSDHLKSRLEVEDVLRSYVPRVTCLRAGMIIGPQGSSFTIVVRLVERLHLMICPRWTLHKSQAVYLDDVTHIIASCIDAIQTDRRTIDIGAEPAMSYKEMLQKTAQLLGKKTLFISLPMLSIQLSKLWVRIVSGAPKDLVYPLVESLREPMLVRPSHRWQEAGWAFTPFETAVRKVVLQMQALKAKGHLPHAFRVWKLKEKSVRSIQRLKLPPGRDAAWVAEQYVDYLPKIFPLLVRVVRDGSLIYLKMRGLPINLLILDHSTERSSPDRQLFYVRGGLLSGGTNAKARLELRETLGGTLCLAAVHDFTPRLPWILYRLTQAVIHAWFMARLGTYIQRPLLAPLDEPAAENRALPPASKR
ncbi:MAG: NAD(P)H-binding protein [Chitinophagaceae bacterium]|nr:NAD(P)H-binding protein [Oligoflexus sp.]